MHMCTMYVLLFIVLGFDTGFILGIHTGFVAALLLAQPVHPKLPHPLSFAPPVPCWETVSWPADVTLLTAL